MQFTEHVEQLDSPLVWIIMGTLLGLIACKAT